MPSQPVSGLSKWRRVSVIAHGAGIFAFTGALALLAAAKAGSAGGYVPSPAVSVPYFLSVFLLATLLLVLTLRIFKGSAVFEAMLAAAILSGAWLVADIYLPADAALAAGSLVVLSRFAWKSPFSSNLALAIGIAGVAAGVAAGLSTNALVILLTALSFYDIVAVHVTGHMVRMSGALANRGVPLAFLLTPIAPSDLFARISENRPALRLGVGDVALPTMLAASALRQGTVPAAASLIGATLGFLAMCLLFLGQRRRAPMPALPPIALGSILGYLASLLILRA